MDKYIRKIITASGHLLKSIQGGTVRKKRYMQVAIMMYVEDMTAMICIAFDCVSFQIFLLSILLHFFVCDVICKIKKIIRMPSLAYFVSILYNLNKYQ